MVVIFMLISVNITFASFRWVFLTARYDLVALGKHPYPDLVIASLSQKKLIFSNFLVTTKSGAKKLLYLDPQR